MDERFHRLGYGVDVAEENGMWVATARRLDTDDSFGPPVPADRADEARERLARWLEWQRTHTHALAALQDAMAIYHRVAADRFAAPGDPARRDALREALVRLDDARRALDVIREQQPWPH